MTFVDWILFAFSLLRDCYVLVLSDIIMCILMICFVATVNNMFDIGICSVKPRSLDRTTVAHTIHIGRLMTESKNAQLNL